MTPNSITQSKKINYTSMVKEPEDYDTETTEIMNISDYSIQSNSLFNNSEGEHSDTEKIKGLGNKNTKVFKITNHEGSIKLPSRYKPKNSSISSSLQNNINDFSINYSDISTIGKISTSITSLSNKHKSLSLDNNSEYDSASVIVEISDKEGEEEIIKTEKSNPPKGKNNNTFDISDHQINELNDLDNLKKKCKLPENRISVATSGDYTYVDSDQPQTPHEVESENEDIYEKSENNIKRLTRLTDTTSVPPVFDYAEAAKDKKIQEDKEADITNNEHKITIEDDEEDNTCAICLIETQKPTDIENITSNKDGSNETVVAPSKEEIDNYECKLHCMHKFHYSCIAQWLERSQNCPICRMEIKHYEIEAIEKRFDISIKVKEEPVPLVVPHYNTTFYFDTDLSEGLVRNYMNEHLPWVKFKPYFYIKYFFYIIMLFILAVVGITLCIISLIKEKMYLATYVIVLILIIGFIIHLCQLIKSIKNKKLIELMIAQPASSSIFYGIVVLIFIILFANLNNLVNNEVDRPITLEDIYQYCIIAFFTVMMIWSCVEVRICYLIFKEDNRRTVDADVSRRNEEIMNRTREQEAREREEFERNFSHLND